MNYKLINNSLGWLVFLITLAVYTLTLEPTASFWDCGEFIAVARHLQTPHPPGAPIFSLLGRLFSLLSGDGLGGFSYSETAAFWINMLSAVSGAATSLFLFWSITIFGKKLMRKVKIENKDESIEFNLGEKIAIFGAGLVGALACTFSDSIWFSAVEAEVYAISLFFTSFVVWAMLKRSEMTDQGDKDRWMILIAYMVGLSIGVHLLNLVAIPALAFIVYFEKEKPTWLGAGIAFLISIVILYLILSGLPGLSSMAFAFDRTFNSMGMPFNVGAFFFLTLLAGGLVFGIYRAIQVENRIMHTAFMSASFILIGFFSYFVIIIRSAQNPSIDENNPEDMANFISYLLREQYGDRPLMFGPQYNIDFNKAWSKHAQDYPNDMNNDDIYIKKGPRYRQDTATNRYVTYDDNAMSYGYPSESKSFLPRMYSNDGQHVQKYREIITNNHNGVFPAEYDQGERISFWDNMNYLFQRQMGTMYFRYFLWNFVGRERQEQYAGVMMPNEKANCELPALIQHPARNNFFMIPLILGIIGLVFHLFKDQFNFAVIITLFVFTGIAIIFYLNAPPFEPRERDYAYSGSYMAFCIWIGLAVIAVYSYLQKIVKNLMASAALATALCMIAPYIMAAGGWDDHDRSRRYFSVDSAKNLLNSCEENAILFTAGDNDTFPLWYVQEVEGFRTDVRVCNLSLLNTDWYVDQMKRKSHKSEPLPITFEHESYLQGSLDYLPFNKNSTKCIARNYYVKQGDNFTYNSALDPGISLDEYVTGVRNKSAKIMDNYGEELMAMKIARKYFIDIDTQKISNLTWIPKELKSRIASKIVFDNGEGALYKKDLIMMDIINSISKTGWDRPIYFSTTAGSPGGENFLGIREFLQQEALAYRLIPAYGNGQMNKELTSNILTKKFFYGERPGNKGLKDTTICYTDDYGRMVGGIQMVYLQLMSSYIQSGEKEKAKEIIEFYNSKISNRNFPWDRFSPMYLDTYYSIYGAELGDKEAKRIIDENMDVLNYYVDNQDNNVHAEQHISNSFEILGQEGLVNVLNKNQRKGLADQLLKDLAKIQPRLISALQ